MHLSEDSQRKYQLVLHKCIPHLIKCTLDYSLCIDTQNILLNSAQLIFTSFLKACVSNLHPLEIHAQKALNSAEKALTNDRTHVGPIQVPNKSSYLTDTLGLCRHTRVGQTTLLKNVSLTCLWFKSRCIILSASRLAYRICVTTLVFQVENSSVQGQLMYLIYFAM